MSLATVDHRPRIAPMPVIWSGCHTGPLVADHMIRIIDRAAAEGVEHVEIGGHATDMHRFVDFDSLPALKMIVDATRVTNARDQLDRIVKHADQAGIRLGMWHHEISGPTGLLDAMPGLIAADGWIDLDSNLLYDYIRATATEFFSRFPQIAELVVTLTESHIPVARRPFCDVPVAERIRRVLQALADVIEPLGKPLVIRPFSAVRSDELNVREAVAQLDARHIVMMYKTEPFDWHPFLENEELIGSVPNRACRAELDCGAEYYGQAVIPVCYTNHLEQRLRAAAARGADTAVLRVDRGAHHPSLETPVNEANAVALTRWLRSGELSLHDELCRWINEQHGCEDPALAALFEKTFDVIRGAFYIDQHAMSHFMFPSLEHAKHILLFGLFEPNVSLDHMSEIWSVVPGRRTPSHEAILAEKDRAVQTAREIVERFSELAERVKPESYEAIRPGLERLATVASAFRQLTRLIAAHTAEMWSLSNAADPFEVEADRMLDLANEIEQQCGPSFFPRDRLDSRYRPITEKMREWVTGLREERALERSLRTSGDDRIIDNIPCGFATEGHRVTKQLHTGATPRVGNHFVREAGAGEDHRCSYHLRAPLGKSAAIIIELSDDASGRPGHCRVMDTVHEIAAEPFDGFQTMRIELPAIDVDELIVSYWSTGAHGVRISRIQLIESD